ncbi:MAG TPA: GntR family transcriptional regulator [Solirubrobacteraceae bacterium]|nr:GntR family transcriptional regulator [Solirubrobacteraceae bacterium]
MLQPLENRPVSSRAREALLSAIRAGAFPGGRLPPEEELAVRLGVSRTTVRSALQALQEVGLISRARGRGTWINQHLLRASMRLNRLVPFTELIEQCGHRASVDLQRSRVAPASEDPEGAAALGLKPGEPCLMVQRLLRAGGVPVIAILDVVPVHRLLVPPDEVRHADSTFELLRRVASPAVQYAASEIIPRVAGDDGAGLPLAPGMPYIELLETLYGEGHERVAVSRVNVDDSVVRLSLVRRAQ